MSDDTYATRLSDSSAAAFEEFAEDQGGWTNYRATRELVEDGLKANGYLDGAESNLSKVANEGMRFGAYSAAVVLGLDLATPFPLTAAAVALLGSGLVMALIASAEPGLTNRVMAFRTKRKALADGGETE
jgi:hypothetical protein